MVGGSSRGLQSTDSRKHQRQPVDHRLPWESPKRGYFLFFARYSSRYLMTMSSSCCENTFFSIIDF